MSSLHIRELRRIVFTVAVVVLGFGHAQAAETLLICVPGGAGSTADAAPRIATFLDALGAEASLELEGHYYTDMASCEAALKEKKPTFVLFDLKTFSEKEKDLKLTPLLEVEHASGVATRYHVVARKGTDFDTLKGKTLHSPHWDKVTFLSRVGFRQALEKHVSGKSASALRSIKNLARGKVDAILLNEQEYQGMAELDFAADFTSILASDLLPGVPLCQVGKLSKSGKALQRAGGSVCTKSSKACEAVEIGSLKKASTKTYQTLLSRFSSK